MSLPGRSPPIVAAAIDDDGLGDASSLRSINIWGSDSEAAVVARARPAAKRAAQRAAQGRWWPAAGTSGDLDGPACARVVVARQWHILSSCAAAAGDLWPPGVQLQMLRHA